MARKQQTYQEVKEREAREAKVKYLKGAKKSVFRKVLRFAKPHRKYLYLTFLFNAFQSLGELLVPIFMGYAINCIVGPGQVDFAGMWKWGGLMIGAALMGNLFSWLSELTINTFSYRVTHYIRALFFKKINTVPLNYIDTNSHGDLLSRMVNDVDSVTDGFLESIATAIQGVVGIIGTIISMFLLNVTLALVILIITPMSILVSWYIISKARKLYNKELATEGEISGFLEEYIGGGRLINAFCQEDEVLEKFDKINDKYCEVGKKTQFYGVLSGPVTRFINGLVYGVVGLVGALLAINGHILIGTISTFLSYANSFGKPFNQISGEIGDIQMAFAAARRVFAVLEEKDEISDSHLPDLLDCDGDIEIKNVSFSYTPKTKLIQNFNLNVAEGQKIAIVGPTGCGKTTLINLLMRFYDVNDGAILVSGNDIREITRKSLRNKYGMVLQDTWLFNASIRDNIAYGNPNIKIEDVIEAAKLAGVHEFIEKMPDGYDTMITEGGANLSQGEKQLICIARIMLLKPRMLILDEATSNIDTRTEKRIQEAFDVLMKGRTTFVVAHRLSTIINADKILVMNKGNVIEQGTHDELMKKKGFYANLYNSQFARD